MKEQLDQALYLDIHSRLFILILSGKTISFMCCEVNKFILILSLLFPSLNLQLPFFPLTHSRTT